MDHANRAVEDVLGKLVTYTFASGSTFSDPLGQLKGDFQESYVSLDGGLTVDVSERMSALDFRRSLLDELGLSPRQGDLVALSVGGVERTYRVRDVRTPAPTSCLLVLGERGTP